MQVWRDRGLKLAGATSLTLAALLTPLVLAFGFSLARRMIYVVARYDFISWGAYYLLAGAVLSRLRFGLAGPALILWLALSLVTLVPYFTNDRRLKMGNFGNVLARTLKARARPAEMVILAGGTGPTTEYYLRDVPGRFRLVAYPLGTDDHLGWFDFRIGPDPAFAISEARRFTAWMVGAPPVPQVVWVAAPKTQGTGELIAELVRLGYRRDAERSTAQLLCLHRAE
jgi:hypothetical protein